MHNVYYLEKLIFFSFMKMNLVSKMYKITNGKLLLSSSLTIDTEMQVTDKLEGRIVL